MSRMMENFFFTSHYYSIFPAALCNRALGMQNGRVRNNKITASSSYNRGLATWRSRLNKPYAWCAKHNNHNQWLKVDFGRSTKVTGIALQGRSNTHQWVTRYYVHSSLDGVHWATYRHRSNNKVGQASRKVCHGSRNIE